MTLRENLQMETRALLKELEMPGYFRIIDAGVNYFLLTMSPQVFESEPTVVKFAAEEADKVDDEDGEKSFMIQKQKIFLLGKIFRALKARGYRNGTDSRLSQRLSQAD